MYKFDTLVLFINAVAQLSGIKYAEHDWLSSINDGSGRYPMLKYFVESYQADQVQEGATEWRLRMALKTHQNNGQGAALKVSQKPGKWDELEAMFTEFFNSLAQHSNGNVQLYIKPQYKPDELSQGNDMLIWLNANVTLLVSNCGAPGPIPEVPQP